jgi:hypothetical protein
MLINDFTVANWRILRMFDNRTCETDSINNKILNYNYRQVFGFEVLELWRRKKFRFQTGYIMSHSWHLIYSLIGIVQGVYNSEDGV